MTDSNTCSHTPSPSPTRYPLPLPPQMRRRQKVDGELAALRAAAIDQAHGGLDGPPALPVSLSTPTAAVAGAGAGAGAGTGASGTPNALKLLQSVRSQGASFFK